jgi:PIN domain nuclease of toxin-antitoxin system
LSLLLDSHIFLWFDHGDSRLSEDTRTRIELEAEVYVSVVSIWELSIKRSLGKLPGLHGSLQELALRNSLTILPIETAHAEAISSLPRHHGDPFDHLLLAQAKVEALTLVTHDRILSEYGVPVLLA